MSRYSKRIFIFSRVASNFVIVGIGDLNHARRHQVIQNRSRHSDAMPL